MTSRGLVLASLFLVATASQAFAQPSPSADPETLIRQGNELRRKGQDARAEGYFRRAYEIAPTPRTAAQLGLAELALQDFLAAAAHLGDALRAKDAWIDEHRSLLEQNLATAERHLARIELAGLPTGATCAIGDAPARPAPADGVVWIAPRTSVAIRIEAPQHQPQTVRVSGEAGQKVRVAVALTPIPVEAPTPVERAPEPVAVASPPPPALANDGAGRGLRVAGIAVGAAGVVAAVLGGALYADGSSKHDSYASAITNHTAYDPSWANWRSHERAGAGLLIGGGVGAVGGAALYVLGWRAGHSTESGTGVSFLSVRGTAGLVYQGTF